MQEHRRGLPLFGCHSFDEPPYQVELRIGGLDGEGIRRHKEIIRGDAERTPECD